jgi:Sulfotransferase family
MRPQPTPRSNSHGNGNGNDDHNDRNSDKSDNNCKNSNLRRPSYCRQQRGVSAILILAVATLIATVRSTRRMTRWFQCSNVSSIGGRSVVAFQNLSLSSSSTTSNPAASASAFPVAVGNQGVAVLRAITHGLQQHRPRWPRPTWDILGNTTCVIATAATSTSGTDLSASASYPNMEEIRAQGLPEALLLGVQKCGTTALYEYLDQHGDIAETVKEPHFLTAKVDDLLYAIHDAQRTRREREHGTNSTTAMVLKGSQISAADGGIPQALVRRMYGTKMRNSMEHPNRDAGKMVMDMTPGNLFAGERIVGRISCILPWAKLMVLLRNPVERTRSQYDMKLKWRSKQRYLPTFSEYVRNDLDALKETGVIQDWSVVDFDAFFESDAMQEAWRTYVHSGLNAPIGMGLYALQIRPFLALPNEFLAIRSEELQAHPAATLSKVLDFLGLPPIEGHGGRRPISFSTTVNSARPLEKTGIDASTEALLREVFEPFNRKLAQMLGEEWEGVWEDNPDT